MSNAVSPDGGLPQIEFLFLGGNLAVDFVNTRRSRRVLGSRRIIQFDQLWDARQVEAWWREACARHGLDHRAYEWKKADVELLIRLRAELRGLLESIIAGKPGSTGSPAVLNHILARGSFSLSLTKTGPRRTYSPRGGKSDPLLAIALAAQELLAERELSRLRHCQSELCTMLFYDTTRSGTRHWCRQSCMNRARARANYWKGERGKQRSKRPISREGGAGKGSVPAKPR